MKSVLIVTDAWHPQVNGVVNSLEQVALGLRARGMRVEFLTPGDFPTVPMPGYKEIRLSIALPRRVRKRIEMANVDAIHIATEGPLGAMARRYCVRNELQFSTSYHTQFPEYLRARVPVPIKWSYRYLRRFHAKATYCLVPTKTVAERLKEHGFTNTVIWSRGVDTDLFHPDKRVESGGEFDLKRPVFLFVGRVAVEKNIEAFLKLDLPGTKLVVGSGPQEKALGITYPDTVFAGIRQGEELARFFASADCFVFPSRTDTFGLVLLEALASGVPVAAYPVTGPIDVIGDSGVGSLDEDLGAACAAALKISRKKCREYASGFSWEASVDQFLKYLPPTDRPAAEPPAAAGSGAPRDA
ncbi:MAG: glycosyltransferase family 1 protein [Alphaproteobacteria bacterium]|nr:glycosyltransferase family 1 protein [Alphaproteobacteria bacterium]